MIQMFTKKRRKGFTLIELIVVIAIMGILAAIAIPKFQSVTATANAKANLAEHQIAVSAVQLFRAASATNALPTVDTDLDPYIEGGWAGLKSGTHGFAYNATTGVTITSTSKTTIIAP